MPAGLLGDVGFEVAVEAARVGAADEGHAERVGNGGEDLDQAGLVGADTLHGGAQAVGFGGRVALGLDVGVVAEGGRGAVGVLLLLAVVALLLVGLLLIWLLLLLVALL